MSVRVIQIIHSLAPGGAESLLVGLARVAPGAGVQVAVLPLVRCPDQSLTAELRKLGVTVFDLGLVSRWDLRAIPRAERAVRAWGPDVIHTHLKHADLVGAAVGRRLGIPVISTLHVIESAPTPLGRAKRGAAAAARGAFAARTITVSEAQRHWYVSSFPQRGSRGVVTVHNGVPPLGEVACRRSARRELGLPDDAVAAVALGLLREGKGHGTLLDAVASLHELHDMRLLIAGDGPLRERLQRAAQGLEDRVRFLGYRGDVPALLAAADLVVHPSEEDAFPTALLEALRANRSIVATRVGGIPEIVTPDVGLLVPPKDPGALAAAMRLLIEDPARRCELGRAAGERFAREFDATAWAARLRALYDEVLTESRRECANA
jgi:glycosyltransferase involved in cell wall biosynthesis